MKRGILLIGGGGHCKSVLNSLIKSNIYDMIGIVEKNDSLDDANMAAKVVGTDDDLPNLKEMGYTDAFITVGSIGDTGLREKLYKKIKSFGFSVPVIADDTAIIAEGTNIGEGTYIGKGVIINSDVCIGKCSIVNSGAIIEHECVIGDYVHISPGSTLCGGVKVDNRSHIGAGAVVIQNIFIGEQVLIGAGSVVVNNVKSNTVAYGNPCKFVRGR